MRTDNSRSYYYVGRYDDIDDFDPYEPWDEEHIEDKKAIIACLYQRMDQIEKLKSKLERYSYY